MIILGEKPNIRDELLGISTSICQNQTVEPIAGSHNTAVWWANTVDLSPGMGILARLDRPAGSVGAKAVKSLLIAYSREGESSVTVENGADPKLFEDDATALYVRDLFAQNLFKHGLVIAGKPSAIRRSAECPVEYLLAAESFDQINSQDVVGSHGPERVVRLEADYPSRLQLPASGEASAIRISRG